MAIPRAARPVSVGVWAAAEAVRRAERLAPFSGLRNDSVPAFQRSERCSWTGEADDSEGTKSVNIPQNKQANHTEMLC
jgi:hypothetical protein